MNTDEAVRRLGEIVRRKHLALSTERTYCAWLRRYCDFLTGLPLHLPSEHKLERFLTALARNNVAASTQNQAFNAIIFFYKEALGAELKNVQALRARRHAGIRHAPTPSETRLLLKTIQSDAAFATSLAVRLLYGCGLRVSEPLNLRIKDVNLEAAQLTKRYTSRRNSAEKFWAFATMRAHEFNPWRAGIGVGSASCLRLHVPKARHTLESRPRGMGFLLIWSV